MIGVGTIAALEDADVLVTDQGLGEAERALLAERVGDLVIAPSP
ncbi:hypothetical protein ACFQHO_50195 [Actinomadura yumaensis]